MAKESAEAAALRWKMLRLVQEAYPRDRFSKFLEDAMDVLGFDVTGMQQDIGAFLAYHPGDVMVMAGRGEAKSTIACILAVFVLIHDPSHRHLLISAGEAKAKENSHLIVSLLTGMPELKCLLPDTQNGDRSSVEEFDVHYTLKGISASPSVRCLGVTANTQGFRSDTTWIDDVESAKNSETQQQREKLLQLTRDFPSVCVGRPEQGVLPRLAWLGTPQSRDSIYNTLPGRGVTVRVWPHRYPTQEQLPHYGGLLAPYVTERLQDSPGLMTGGGALGNQGQPTDPKLKSESTLQAIELNQGTPFFQLQHMLSTALTDANRYPLKTEHLVLSGAVSLGQVPAVVKRSVVPATAVKWQVGSQVWALQTPAVVGTETLDCRDRVVGYVDPAAGGANGDETAYAVGCIANGSVWGLSCGGLRGGYDLAIMEQLAQRLAECGVTHVVIEQNMGHGGFRQVFTPVLFRIYSSLGLPQPSVADDLVPSTLKEKRIVAALAPVMGRGSLVLTQPLLDQDRSDCERYGPEERVTRSLLHQVSRMQETRGAVKHDDRVDALRGLVQHFMAELVTQQEEAHRAMSHREFQAGISRALGHGRLEQPITRRLGALRLKDRRR